MKFIIDREVIKGHDNYFSIMNLIANPSIDVSSNKEFQKAYSLPVTGEVDIITFEEIVRITNGIKQEKEEIIFKGDENG